MHAIVPLALLQTVRWLDAPPDDGMDEFHRELAVKRLGTNTTIAAQIERLQGLVARDRAVDADEAAALLRLVSRRSDAALAFTDAGRRAARWAVAQSRGPGRVLARRLPRSAGHRIGLRLARALLRRYFALDLTWTGGRAVASAVDLPSVRATADGAACKFYGAAVTELLGTYTAFEGAMAHEGCQAHGAAQCRWVSSNFHRR